MKINKIFFLILLSFNLFAEEEATYFLPGKTPTFEMEKLEDEKATYFIPGKGYSEEEIEEDEKEILYMLPGSITEPDPEVMKEKDKAFIVNPNPQETPEFSVGNLKDENISQLPAGSKGNENLEFESMDNMSKLNKLRDQSKNNLNFAILYDNFTYGGQPGVYNQLFEESNSSVINNMFFQISYGFTFIKNFVILSAGPNLGASYKYGKGNFSDGQVSDTTIALWALPLDLSVNAQIPLGPLFRIEASGGPSVMVLLQNRSDRDSGESGKDLYQISPGYFVGGRFKINWGQIFKGAALALFNSSDVTNFFLNFDVRYESYNRFSDEYVKVDGISYGLGLSFEFL